MKKFFIKTVILMSLLFLCVLYGMVTAKHGMTDLKGLNVPNDNEKPFSLNIDFPKTMDQVKTSKNSPSIEERAEHLKDIKSFNPYSSLGNTMSNSMSDVFRKGMSMTANMVNQVVHAVL
ncbi:DUF3679 domain-containing protein [Scopulibacillus cellulosilyticus]|uniref:DUF3679 domain-containing protein n=1 Tax=Scopulibacillus cellulosilyticus TaxID=2665665 RepID=A0ABW2PYE7_9BACL